MKWHRCLLHILSWIVLPLHAQSHLTLRECIDYAVCHDVELKDIEAQRLDAAADVRMERNKFLPSVNARLTNGLSSGFQQVLTKEMAGKYESVSSYNNSAQLSVSVPVWSADAQLLSLKLQRKNGQVVDARKAERELSLKMEVVRTVLTIIQVIFAVILIAIVTLQSGKSERIHNLLQVTGQLDRMDIL